MRQFTQEILDKTLSENLTRRLDALYYILSPKYSRETLLSGILRFYTLKISVLWLNRLYKQTSNIGKIV